MSLGKSVRKGGRFSRSPFARPQCTECNHEIPYGKAMIRIEISLPNPDQNKMLASAIFGSRDCANLWLATVEIP